MLEHKSADIGTEEFNGNVSSPDYKPSRSANLAEMPTDRAMSHDTLLQSLMMQNKSRGDMRAMTTRDLV